MQNNMEGQVLLFEQMSTLINLDINKNKASVEELIEYFNK